MATKRVQCDTCLFWEIRRKNQWLGLCTNPENYPIQREYNDFCKGHQQLVLGTVQMQSNVRG